MDGYSLPLLGYCLFHDLDLILYQPVEFVDELVDLAVGGFDITQKAGFLLRVVRG
ncbi:MAG: hypothetical protein HY694_09960 [Deltaproteobacteria bacterium]|nr:hypothetical protein [Deltaproteobacteria bacterium]